MKLNNVLLLIVFLFCGMPLFPQSEKSPTPEQIGDIVYMYEEEKMARDLYTEINRKWKIRQFANIMKSEQTHMDALKTLAEDVSIKLPALQPGSFENKKIQALYNELFAKAMTSRQNAVQVGIRVEEVDIADLDRVLARAAPSARTVYQNLRKGSLNHLDAFQKI